MIIINKPSTMTILLVLLGSSLCLSPSHAQSQTSYIIVHAHNPEGVEIASIQGVGQGNVQIYDGETFIRYGAYNAETHNKPITINPGTHTIKAKFNDMIKEQTVTINANETKVVKFTFDRTEVIPIPPNPVSRRISGSGYHNGGGYYQDAFLLRDGEDPSSDYIYWRVYAGTTAELEFTYDVSASYELSGWTHSFRSNIYMNVINVICSGLAVRPFCVGWLFVYVPCGFSIPATQEFNSWFSQGFYTGEGDLYDNLYHAGDLLFRIAPGRWYGEPSGYGFTKFSARISYDNIVFSEGGRFFWFGMYTGFVIQENAQWSCTLSNFRISSVPYDLTDTGVKDENNPPVASFIYLPEKPMVGGKIEFDASKSKDPDGTVVGYHWDFGDGNSGEGQIVNHAYNKVGEYTVTLTVTDNDGLSDSNTLSLEVTGKQFMITFDDGPLPGKTDQIVSALKGFSVDGQQVRAGFFVVGDNNPLYHALYEWWPMKGSVKDNPATLRYVAEAQAGHLIGNQTEHHACFDIWWADPTWWLIYGSTKDYVMAEISQCEWEIGNAMNKPPIHIFRSPYLVDNQGVRDASGELGYEIIWGKVVDATYSWVWWPLEPPLQWVQEYALDIMNDWDEDEPRVLIFHDFLPITYNHIGEIITFLQEHGFTLTHFDANRIPIQKTEKAKVVLSGIAHSPVDLNIVDPDGLICNKQVNQIPKAIYREVDIDGDGKLDDFFVIPESKPGDYLIQVIPEPGALPEDVYSLQVGDGEKSVILAQNIPVSHIRQQPYLIQLGEDGMKMPPVPQALEGLVNVSVGRPAYDRRTGQFSVNVTVTNNSQTVIGSPVWLVIESISNPGVSLAGADGTTIDGKAYVDLSALLGNGQLDPAETISKRIYFNNPNRVQFTFEPSVRGIILP